MVTTSLFSKVMIHSLWRNDCHWFVRLLTCVRLMPCAIRPVKVQAFNLTLVEWIAYVFGQSTRTREVGNFLLNCLVIAVYFEYSRRKIGQINGPPQLLPVAVSSCQEGECERRPVRN